MRRRLDSAPRGIALLFVASISCCTAAEKESPIESVLRVWRERERTVRTLRFELTDEHLVGKGTGAIEGPLEPAAEVTVKRRTNLTIDGDRMRLERLGEDWIAGRGIRPLTYISLFDGKLNKEFYQHESAIGFLAARGKHSEGGNTYLSPIIRHFRPFSSAFRPLAIDRLKVVATDAEIDKMRCILLEDRLPDGVRVASYWVSPEQGMSVVRYQTTFKDHIEWRLDASYKNDPKHGWVPDKWQATHGTPERRLSAGKLIVEKFSINERVPPQTFEFEFPPGTQVNDKITRTTYVVPIGAKK